MKNSIIFCAFIYILYCQSTPADGLRILGVFPLHGKSHFMMAEQLMKGLAKKGHQVDVIGHFPLKKPFENYNDFSLAGSLPPAVNNMTFETMQGFESFSLKRFIKMTGDSVCELLGHPVFQNIIKNAGKVHYDAVIVEIFSSNCYLIFGQLMKAPMIGIVTASWLDWLNLPLAHPYNPAVTPHSFSKASVPMTFWDRLENVIVNMRMNIEFHYIMEEQKTFIKKYIGMDVDSIYDLQKDMSLILVNSHYTINGVKSLSPGIVEVGGLHVVEENNTLPTEVKKWLDEANKGCIYMSFGSMVKIESFPQRTLDVFYETIKKIAPMKFLIKIAKKDELPPGLPSNAMTYHWLPQLKVLGKILHHFNFKK